jgi:hypothetical protein
MKISDRTIYAVLQRGERVWQVSKSGQLLSMHQCKSDAIDFALRQKNAVIVVAPEPTEGEVVMDKKRVGKATRSQRMRAEVDRKEREHKESIQLPKETDHPVEKNIVKSTSDEARPRPR